MKKLRFWVWISLILFGLTILLFLSIYSPKVSEEINKVFNLFFSILSFSFGLIFIKEYFRDDSYDIIQFVMSIFDLQKEKPENQERTFRAENF